MNRLLQTAFTGGISLILAACGDGSTSKSASPQMAATMTATRAQQGHVAADYYLAVQKIYLAYFGRPADPGGLNYYASLMAGENAPTDLAQFSLSYTSNARLKAMVDGISNSQESKDLYGGDNAAFLDAVYQSLFGRPAEPGGKAFWLPLLNNGTLTRSAAAVTIMAGAQNGDSVLSDKKAQVAMNYTTSLDTPIEQRAHSGLKSTITLRAMLASVKETTNVTAFQSTIDATIAALVAAAPPNAAGAYRSTLAGSGNTTIDMLVLDNDTLWAFYGSVQPSQFVVTSFIQGPGSSTLTSYSSASLKDYGSTPAENDSLTVNYWPTARMDGSFSTKDGAVTVGADALPIATYDYTGSTSLTTLAGSWILNTRAGKSASVTVASNGSFSGSYGACTFTGTLAAHSSGKNLFSSTITYGAGCDDLAGATLNGIAFSYLHNAGATRQLVIAGVSADHAKGSFFSGVTATAAGQVSGLSAVDSAAGSGTAARVGDEVKLNYAGYIYSANANEHKGALFDSGAALSFTLGTGVVIDGWDQGLLGMRPNGERTLVVPSSLAYGPLGTGFLIPPNAALVFDVQMLGVNRPG